MATIDYQGRNNVYTYMGWQLITAPDSQQYKLRQEAGMNFDSEGFGIINGCYVVALTTHYGQVGDYVDFVLANGNTLHTIIGDIKSSTDSNWNEYGHVFGNSLNVIEFVVDYNTWYPSHANPGTSSCHPEWTGLLQSYQNAGNYWTGKTVIDSSSFSRLMVVEGDRYTNNKTWHVWYLATYQEDGYLYFNDDRFWRCHADGSNLQIYYFNKDIWILSNNIKNLKISSFSGSSAHGGGIISANTNVERAVQWMINKANNEYITYSQSVRNLKNPNGSSYDCSSFVITGFYVGGFNVNASYTGNMRSGFTELGFQWIPGSYFDSNACQRGDILLNEVSHTQVYIGNNQDVNCGSTPARVQSHSADNYGRGWDGILRYVE